MDREEYRIRLTTIETFAGQQDFHAAAQVADTVDWKRVKSVRTLCMVEEVYEADGQYDKAERVLQYAYWRANTSRTILYRLTEVNIKRGNLSEALKYCDEFDLLCGKEPVKYILRYKLMTARGDALPQRIKVLETYRETEFSEKWAYELATLYAENGQNEQCAALCSDILSWFKEGKYTERTQALLASVKPAEEEAEAVPAAAPSAAQRTIEIRTDEIAAELAGEREEAEADAFRSTEESEVKNRLADSIRAVVSGIRTESEEAETAELKWEYVPREINYTSYTQAESTSAKKVPKLEPEMIGRTTVAPPDENGRGGDAAQITIDEYISRVPKNEEAADLDALFTETSESLASAVASGRYDAFGVPEPEEESVPAGQMSFEDFLPEVDDAETEQSGTLDAKARLYGRETDESLGLTVSFDKEEMVKEFHKQSARKISAQEEERRRRAVEQTLRSAGAWEEPDTGAYDTAEEFSGAPETDAEQIVEEAVYEEAAAEPETADEAAYPEETAGDMETEPSSADAEAGEIPAEAAEPEIIVTEEPEDAPRRGRSALGEWISKMLRGRNTEPEQEEETTEEQAEPEEASEADARFAVPEESAAEEAAEPAAEPAEEPAEEPDVDLFAGEMISEEPAENAGDAETPSAAEIEAAEAAQAIEEVDVDALFADEVEVQEPEEAAAETEEEPEEEKSATDSFIEAIIEQPEEIERVPVAPRPLDDTEKEIFTYFAGVPGMSEQITTALADIHNNAGDKTSRSGNVMLIGRQGAGKTRLADALMIAVCRDLGLHSAKAAKIIGSDFNRKNPAEVVSKMRGGFLVIEAAGELSDEAVEKLLRAMEFRTDALVVMLEDEKADLRDLLARHPEIEQKFTSTIVIPVFTNDELVSFAKAYAKEKGYRMDEMGILALYTMIGDNQTATEPVTVGRVREMMDAAMARAGSGARRLGRRFAKRNGGSDSRILIREKDFDV